MPNKVHYTECKCAACGETPDETTLFETGWSGIYWCGGTDCAFIIMESECTEVPNEECIAGWECDACCNEHNTEQEAIDCCSEEEEFHNEGIVAIL